MATRNPASYRPNTALDLLRLPGIGALLRHRWGRLPGQMLLTLVALALIIDGFTGPQEPARNLATVAPWVQYRGLVVVVLLLVGNLFCMSCPFALPRTLAKRLSLSGRRFPRPLRNKWLALTGLFGLFFIYEWLDLWSSPALTAWVIVAYFVASFVLEAFFTESAFCKYVCPLGTFNFVYSTLSPTQIGVKNSAVCVSCVGKECVNGNYAPQPIIRADTIPVAGTDETVVKTITHGPQGTLGCGTLLFAPQISSNLDCTFCLDCVRACPHANVGLMTRTPGRELAQPGAWPQRWDVSLLPVMLTFIGLTNAFAMVPPVYELQRWLVEVAGLRSEFLVLLLIFVVGNLLLPVAAVTITAQIGRALTNMRKRLPLRATVAAFAPAFVPLGFGIWFAHYSFHFLISPLSIIAVFQEFLGMTGAWEQLSGGLSLDAIGLLQVVALIGGWAWSAWIVQRAARRLYGRRGFVGQLPWMLLLLVVLLIAVQIFSQPMEMRGTEFLFG
ncbi:MAG: FesM [Anaerolineae bacterium]|nr:FesM [Anaerolineae bacterium]